MSVKGTYCSELCGVMYVKPSLKSHAGRIRGSLYSVHSQKVGCTWRSWLWLQGDCPDCKHAALRPNKFQKEAAQQVSHSKPSQFDILSMNLYMSWVVPNLLNCNVTGRYRITRKGLAKKLYTIYPPKKNYLCIITLLLNAWSLVTGTAVLPDEKCLSSKTEVYLLLSMFSEDCFRSDL